MSTDYIVVLAAFACETAAVCQRRVQSCDWSWHFLWGEKQLFWGVTLHSFLQWLITALELLKERTIKYFRAFFCTFWGFSGLEIGIRQHRARGSRLSAGRVIHIWHKVQQHAFSCGSALIFHFSGHYYKFILPLKSSIQPRKPLNKQSAKIQKIKIVHSRQIKQTEQLSYYYHCFTVRDINI